jgi:hypothetical protein
VPEREGWSNPNQIPFDLKLNRRGRDGVVPGRGRMPRRSPILGREARL